MAYGETEAYSCFAEVYDEFMDNVPYKEWCDYLTGLLKEYGCDRGLVAELGCGTGNMTELLAQAGYDMIGIDNSEEMLGMAMEKRTETGSDILYLLQDMREFELYGTVDAIVCVCDSMNYIIEYKDLIGVFRLVNNYLNPGGIFIFDLNTEYKYRELLGNQTIAENREDQSFIWDNYYDGERKINEYRLTLFVKEEKGLFRKQEEFHYQKAYSLEEIRKAVSLAGMEYVTAYDAFTKNLPEEGSERVYVIAREQGKNRNCTEKE